MKLHVMFFLQKLANSIEQKIKRLRNKIECQRSSVFASAKTESIEKNEVKLKDIHRKIRGLQCGNMQKQKV